jgi:glycosyltransferase involved in cell wall biosynthesis
MPHGVYRRIWHALPLSYSAVFPRADITHFFDYIVPPRVRGRVVDTIHDLSYLYYPETLAPRNRRRIEGGILYSIERSNLIVTVSENTRSALLSQYGLDPEKIRVIYNAAPEPDCSMSLEDLQKKWPLTAPYLLFLGNLEPRKNITGLLRMFALLKNEQGIPHMLVIAGAKGWLYEEIFTLAESLGLSGRILFTGYVSAAEKGALLRHASAFVFLSLYEGFGIPILEAMRAGTPVVCSNTSSMPEVAGDAAVLVDPHDAAAAAEAVASVLTDENLRARKVAAGNLRAAQLTWEDSARRLADIYRSLG